MDAKAVDTSSHVSEAIRPSISSRLAVVLAIIALGLIGCGGGHDEPVGTNPLPDATEATGSSDLGYELGYSDGYDAGSSQGASDGDDAGTTAGQDTGYGDAENGDEREANYDDDAGDTTDGYDPVDDESYDESDGEEYGQGYTAGYDDGYDEAFIEAYRDAYRTSYDDGYDEALTYYRDPAVENPYDTDCSDVGGPVSVSDDDPNNLDRDGDGIGCED